MIRTWLGTTLWAWGSRMAVEEYSIEQVLVSFIIGIGGNGHMNKNNGGLIISCRLIQDLVSVDQWSAKDIGRSDV